MVLVAVSAVSQAARCCFAPETVWGSAHLPGKGEGKGMTVSSDQCGNMELSEAFLTKCG